MLTNVSDAEYMKYAYKNVKKVGKTIGEHRIIMEQHIGRKLSTRECVHHINGNRKDNRIANLVIMTLPEHSHLHMKGRTISEFQKRKLAIASSGARNWNAILTDEKVKAIRNLLSIGVKGTRIAKDFGVGKKCISDIKLGKRWAHV